MTNKQRKIYHVIMSILAFIGGMCVVWIVGLDPINIYLRLILVCGYIIGLFAIIASASDR